MTGEPLPSVAQEHLVSALRLKEQGALDAAIEEFEAAIAADPDTIAAHYALAMTFKEQGQHQKAIVPFENVLRLDSSFPDVYRDLCQAQFQSGRVDSAAATARSGIALHPTFADLPYFLGNIELSRGRFDDAIRAYDDALAIAPAYPEVLHNRGTALRNAKRLPEALASYEAALHARPDYFSALVAQGEVLRDLARPAQALASFEVALKAGPDSPELLNNCGLLRFDLKRFEEARLSYDQALELRPDFAAALNNRGLVFLELRRFDEALRDYDRALAIDAALPDLHANRGNVLRELARHEEALAAYESALRLRPEFEGIFLNQAFSRLVLGDLPGGWPKYEWRWQTKDVAKRKRSFPQPVWHGRESLEGKTILLHAEQGLGDTIQFCRYAQLVADRGAKVLLEVQPPLTSVLGQVAGVHRLLAEGDPLPEFDLHCPLLSLPLAFETSLDTIPRSTGYVRLHDTEDAKRIDAWLARLELHRRLRVGVVWSGNPNHKDDAARSIPLERFGSLLDFDAEFFSLQDKVRDTDKAALAQLPQLKNFAESLRSFADTAALISHLDLVISVDTSVAHLAAAMGKPTWVLLPVNPDWRWLLERTDSPWYETVCLYRQANAGDWGAVLDRVRQDLKNVDVPAVPA